MQIWLETTELSVLEKASRRGILHGVMTTPAMLASHPKETLKNLLNAQTGSVAVEVRAGDFASMISQGKALHAFSSRILVKVPVTEKGFEALHALSKEQIPVMASAVVQPTQGLVAAAGGAEWIAPYFSRVMKAGDNPLAQLEAIKKFSLKAKILAVNPKTLEQIKACAEIGIDAVSIREDLFRDLIETHELTAHALEQFEEDWKKIESQGWF